MSEQLRLAAAEVIAAHREHEAMLLVGGHEPKRVDDAVRGLDSALRADRLPTR
jgi:hypothetical protein